MSDKGKDPLPIFKKSISLTKKKETSRFCGQVQEKHIIIFKLSRLNAIL